MTGRIFAITGAAGVLGSAVAKAAAAQGARLALLDHTAHCPGPEGAFVQSGVDLTDAVHVARAFDAIVAEYGGIDVLLNIAGGFRWQTLEDGDPKVWSTMHSLNLLSAANACRAAVPCLKRSASGRIVNVGAFAALRAGGGMGPYAASKAGVHALTQSLAEELKGHGVTVNAVLPSILDTPTNREDMPDADFSAWVSPADLASVILFLASEEARAVTGALVPVTGRV